MPGAYSSTFRSFELSFIYHTYLGGGGGFNRKYSRAQM